MTSASRFSQRIGAREAATVPTRRWQQRAVSRLTYLATAQDRSGIVVASCVFARTMARSRLGDEVRFMRMLRYLKSHTSCAPCFASQDASSGAIVCIGSDWSGDTAARKSTSGVVATHGLHLVSFSSRRRHVVALRSEEAALNAHVLGLWEGLGIVTLCKELSIPGIAESLCDSSGARGIASRVGPGKLKHVQANQLWTQDLVRCGRATNSWGPQQLKSADALVHPCTEATLREHPSRVGVVVRPELSSSAPGGGCRPVWGVGP